MRTALIEESLTVEYVRNNRCVEPGAKEIEELSLRATVAVHLHDVPPLHPQGLVTSAFHR